MTGQEPADRMADAERAGFTGAIYGPAAFNPGDDRGVRQVFIYRRGACTDRYVTTIRRQPIVLPASCEPVIACPACTNEVVPESAANDRCPCRELLPCPASNQFQHLENITSPSKIVAVRH